MRKASPVVIAILTADIHLSMTAPEARQSEPNWFMAMARPLQQIRGLQTEHRCPVLIAGDIYHLWKSPAELINFAMNQLPNKDIYAIPGQHDLPFHSAEGIEKSSFWTLVLSGKVQLLPIHRRRFVVHGCSFDVTGKPWNNPKWKPDHPVKNDGILQVLITHEYLRTADKGWEGDDPAQTLSSKHNPFAGYDVIVSGDNHIPFTMKWTARANENYRGTTLFNCGSLMRRNIDQSNHSPRVGLLFSDGSIESKTLDISEDHMSIGVGDEVAQGIGGEFTEFLDELRDLKGTSLDFPAALRRSAKHLRPEVRKILLEALDHAK